MCTVSMWLAYNLVQLQYDSPIFWPKMHVSLPKSAHFQSFFPISIQGARLLYSWCISSYACNCIASIQPLHFIFASHWLLHSLVIDIDVLVAVSAAWCWTWHCQIPLTLYLVLLHWFLLTDLAPNVCFSLFFSFFSFFFLSNLGLFYGFHSSHSVFFSFCFLKKVWFWTLSSS